jgi:hypothetical protein
MADQPTHTQFGMLEFPNPGREFYKEYGRYRYARYPVRTHLVQIGEDYMSVIKKYAAPSLQPGDLLVLSEKFIGISQKRVVHESQIHAGWLARLICKFTTKYSNDIAWENPKKMQVAINEAGMFRAIYAVIWGGIRKYIFRRPGVFYEIMGRDIAAIDGFNPIAIPPFNEYAMLAPEKPNKVCQEIEKAVGVPTVIVDASNVAVHLLGKSGRVHSELKLEPRDVEALMEGNPMGQGREQTPIAILRKE